MKNQELKKVIDTIVSTGKKVTITKTDLCCNAINIFVEETSEDIGTYPYYARLKDRDADFELANKLIN